MESAAALAGDVVVVRYATAAMFVAALEPHLRRSSWAANLLLAPAFAPSASECLFLATWPSSTTSAGASQRPRPVLMLARVDAFPIFVSFTDACDGNDVEVVGRHVEALAEHLAGRVSAEWLGTVRRVTGPAWLSRPLADAVGRLLNRRATPHWTLTAAACTSTTLRLVDQAGSGATATTSGGGGEEGEVRRFVVGRDDEERLARLYEVFVLPPTPIDECRHQVRRTLADEPGSRVFVHVMRSAADDHDINDDHGDVKKKEEEEVITGFLYLKRETPFNFAISAVCTAPEYRCRGIAGRLVRAATRWALAPADSDGGGGKKEVCIFWMEEAPGRIYRKAGFGDDGMMGDWAGWTFEGLDAGPWPS
ncbi:acetyltransferase, GNAT superfamily protein [Acanthamoeba castellanii str. Neff]|uniref:Acetyltransferase, GNAT superfamily protein n=1 Tax=Acanthamoeba castellanii (strain ATCC 30010 / Neff) TaxID=1257118 RepID=L8GLU2_ACACF|nr:acetyltransferase, GNAT superfamily protein [Acanthamoeba castellanii str. Neff]ELR13683.1 acetyltransferase, GNAT superfamily protein [Acanthamoeba castellanii str. Neff]